MKPRQGEMWADGTPFDGYTYDPSDYFRLTTLLGRVFDLMRDERWRTLSEIQAVTGGTETAISARLRDFRKAKFGGYQMESRRRTGGLWEYRVLGG